MPDPLQSTFGLQICIPSFVKWILTYDKMQAHNKEYPSRQCCGHLKTMLSFLSFCSDMFLQCKLHCQQLQMAEPLCHWWYWQCTPLLDFVWDQVDSGRYQVFAIIQSCVWYQPQPLPWSLSLLYQRPVWYWRLPPLVKKTLNYYTPLTK